MVGHVVRFMEPYRKLKHRVDTKEFGELKFLSLNRFSGIPAWGEWNDKKVTGKSGGALFDLVIHDIDFAAWVLGIPDEISAGYLPGQLSDHDYISAMWNYRDKGILVKIEGGNIFHATFPFRAGFTAGFENATLSYTTLKSDVIGISDNKKTTEIPAGDIGAGYYNEIEYFAECLKNNSGPSECTPESSLQSVRLCYEHLK
jgi:predicted dehydrogenase